MTNQGSHKRYSKQGLLSLFMVSAFPIHLWAIILILNDIAWISERTNFWDAIGVAAYGLVFAFIESVFVFLVVVLLGFLLPKGWTEDKRLALLSILLLVTALWAIVGQLYFFLGIQLPWTWIQYLAESGHPLRIMYAATFLLVGVTVSLPALWVIFSERATQIMINLTERLVLLTSIYLFFDVVALIIIIVRNL